MKKLFLFTAIAGMALAISGCNSAASTADIPPVADFSVEKYLGTWYEIARLPHRFERNLTAVKTVYSLRPDGQLKVVNSGRENGREKCIEGVAKLKNHDGNGELRVSFFRPFYGDYRIIHLTPDYTVAVVTSDTRDYLWILARTPVMKPDQLRECLNLAAKHGFETGLLQYPQGKFEFNN